MDLAGNTNTASSSTDNSVHFTLSGGGIIMPFAPLTPTDPIRMDIGDDEDMAEVSHVTEEEDGDELLDQDDGHSNTDESPLNPTSFPNNTADTTTTTTSSDNTTNNNSSNGAANNSPTSDSAPTASSGQLLVTTDTPTTENVITETPKDTEEATIDIGGGNATKKPSYALAWILLGLIALLNFAWFYTRKNNPPQNPQV